MKKQKLRLIFLLFSISLISIFFIFEACQYYHSSGEDIDSSKIDTSLTESYDIIEVTGYSFTLEWDAPLGAAPNSYNIYYKEHASKLWILLDTIPYSQLEYEINYNDLDSGDFHDFGISAIYYGEESFLHSSLDNEAEPSTGWYIKWVLK